MKVAIALRTCGQVFNWWNVPDRIVDVSKQSLILTCLNSLVNSIKNSKHEIIFSIHDDNSSNEFINAMKEIIGNVKYQLINTKEKENCITQYQWLTNQECDYVYHVEDDYLHTSDAIDNMVDLCEYMKSHIPFVGNHYAVFPMNHPHRYMVDNLYPSIVVKANNQYWRTIFHSSLTFFMEKKTHVEFNEYVKSQAYGWANRIPEDETINRLWANGKVRLLCPMNSLAWHIADKSHEDTINDWKTIWNQNWVNYDEKR